MCTLRITESRCLRLRSCYLHVIARPLAVRQRQQPLVQSAAAAGAGGINDNNKERVVKGNVGEPSKAQPTVTFSDARRAVLL